MADKKITELNSVNLPLDGTEQIPIVQNGETKKVSADELGGGGGESLWQVSTGANSLVPKNSSSVASGDGAIAEGQNTVAQGDHSTAMGLGSIAIGNFSLAQGRSTTAQGEGSVAQGEDTFALGKGSFASGIESNANGDSSSAIGDNVTSNAFGETVVGAYNEVDTTFNPTVSVPEDKAFSVGVGSFGSEANGIVVRKNGIVTANAMTQALFDADTSGKIVVTKEVLETQKVKRVININLPFIRITSATSDDLFYQQKSFGVYPDFTSSTGKTDKNTLVGNQGKALLQVPFDCKIKSIQFSASPSTDSELVIGKTNSNVANYVNVYENTFNSGFFDDNPTNLFTFSKGEYLIPYFKIKTQGVAYSRFNITLEEI